MKRLHKNTKGFTLVELLLYIGVFGMVIGSIVGLSILSTSQRLKNQVIADVNFQGEAVIANFTQAVHDATAVVAPTSGNTGSILQLTMPNITVSPTTYDSFNDGTTTRVRIGEGAVPTLSYLTNSHVTLSGLSFTNAGLSGSKGSIKLQFTLTYRNLSGRDEYNYNKTFYGTSNLK